MKSRSLWYVDFLEDKLNEVNGEEEVINKDVNQVWEGIKNVLFSFRESSIKQFKKVQPMMCPG